METSLTDMLIMSESNINNKYLKLVDKSCKGRYNNCVTICNRQQENILQQDNNNIIKLSVINVQHTAQHRMQTQH